jgi:predicted aldo/keto reductase-like oxidoreductase
VFSIHNDYLMYGDENRSQMFYSWLDEKTRADRCVECGECLEKCPQGIDIPEWMKKVHEVLATRQS